MLNKHASETWTEDEAIQKLSTIFDKVNVYRQHDIYRISKELKEALKYSQEKGYGNRPEAIILFEQRPFLIFEAKGANGKIEDAVLEVTNYAKAIFEKGIRIPFLLAIKEKIVQLLFQDEYGNIKNCIDQNLLSIHYLPTINEFKNLLANNGKIVFPQTSELTNGELAQFCKTINEIFHSNNIVESERANLFTAFLIALSDKGFKHNFLNNKGRLNFEKDSFFAESIRNEVNTIINKIKLSKKLNLSNKIMLSDDKDSHAIWAVTEYLLTKANSNDYFDNLINSTYLLGDIYETFHTYTGKNSMGQYFTPRHIVEFMVDLVEVIRREKISYMTDIIYDPACGVGGFLVSTFKKAIFNARLDEKENANEIFGQNGLFGVECAANIASIAKVNMLLRGDGKSGILESNSLKDNISDKFENIYDNLMIEKKNQEKAKKQTFIIDRKIKPTIVLMNPPFPATKDDPKAYEFIDHAVSLSAENAIIAALIPTGCILGKNKDQIFRKEILKKCQLKAVITLPHELFYPKASINTSVIILEKNKNGHDQTRDIIFSRALTDGYKINKSTGSRIAHAKKNNDLHSLLNDWLPKYYELGELDIPLNFISKKLTKNEILNGEEWTPEARLTGKTLYQDVIKNHNKIYAQLLSVEIFNDISLNSFHANNYLNRQYVINNIKIEAFKNKLITEYKKMPSIEQIFNYSNGNYKSDLSLVNEVGCYGVISATEFNNGVIGYEDQLPLETKRFKNGLSLAKNGKPCVVRVHTKFESVLTQDVLFLIPKKEYTEEELIMLASIIEQKNWRFSYGRKANWDRIKNLCLFE